MNPTARKFLSLNPVFYSLYILGLIIAVPLSLIVWFIRRELFVERSIAGGQDVSFRYKRGEGPNNRYLPHNPNKASSLNLQNQTRIHTTNKHLNSKNRSKVSGKCKISEFLFR